MLNSVLFLLLVGSPAPETVTFKTVAGQELKMDVYSPATVSGRVPAVVVVHGGAWTSGDRTQMAQVCRAIADSGMVAVATSYRLAPTHKWPAMIEDVQDSVRYVRDNAAKLKVDPNRIGAAGASAGGHLSLLLGTTDGWPNGNSTGKTSSKVKAVFNLFGPTDLSQDFNRTIANMLSQQVLGKPFAEATAEIKSFSPVTFVTRDAAPVYTVQGKADPLVPYKQAERLDEVLKKNGVPHTLVLVEGMVHGVNQSKPAELKAVADAVAWLKAQLAG